uniref:THAP domain-containing protein 5 isoform X2 n=1 Tax=Monopterus albus TaxID=43700 RepID=UPI0009B349C8|nr:THAP domain-containing protein 5 isoform X2 [Monopterus albus]
MPRYCAVKTCRNRGGAVSRFPLYDKPRLQKWVDNMKREEWTPSRHQYLCSEHFTEDCFDIRWGIRYLKNTAIPTIFPSAEDDGEKKVATIKRAPKAKPRTVDMDAEPTGFDSSLLTKRPLILSRTFKKIQSSTTDDTVTEHTEMVFDLPLVLGSGSSCHANPSEMQTAACEVSGDSGMPVASFLALFPYRESHSEVQTDSTVTVLCCESLDPFSDVETSVDAAVPQAALGEAYSFVPVEIVKDGPTGCFVEERGPSEGEHIFAYEHSYCRPDTDKEQLWSKILSLHAKIMELDHREESTVAKIHALETEIAHLKKDGAVFKEKQKVLEEYISSILL